MGYELGGVYFGQMMAKDAMHKALYGKAFYVCSRNEKTSELIRKAPMLYRGFLHSGSGYLNRYI